MQGEMKKRINALVKIGLTISEKYTQIASATCASSIAYFTFLSLIPLLAICISLLTAVGISEQEVTSMLLSIIPDELSEFVSELISDAFSQSEVALSISGITLLWSVSKVARALRYGLNAAYAQLETRSGIAVTIISIFAGFIMEVLVAATIYLVFKGSLIDILAIILPGLTEKDTLMDILNALITMAISAASLSLCYTYLPDGKRSPASQLPGAVIAVLACAALSFCLKLYVDFFGGNTALYGSIATIALFLIWIYSISSIILAGGFINRILKDRPQMDKDSARSGDSRRRLKRPGVSVPLSKAQKG